MNTNQQLDELAKRFDAGEISSGAEYLAQVTKICNTPPKPQPDYRMENHGSVWLVRPLNRQAEQNVDEKTGDDAQFWSGSLVVEARYVESFVAQLREEGWVVE